jgi:hypothetical protein
MQVAYYELLAFLLWKTLGLIGNFFVQKVAKSEEM